MSAHDYKKSLPNVHLHKRIQEHVLYIHRPPNGVLDFLSRHYINASDAFSGTENLILTSV